MSELTLQEYCDKDNEAEVCKQKRDALVCRLKDPAWTARDGWPRTNAMVYGGRDELQRRNC